MNGRKAARHRDYLSNIQGRSEFDESSGDIQARRFQILRRRKFFEGVAKFGEESHEGTAAVEEHLVVGLGQHPGEADGGDDKTGTFIASLLQQILKNVIVQKLRIPCFA